MDIKQRINAFLNGNRFAVAGASQNRHKYGNKVLRAYLQSDRDVVAVNPTTATVENVPSYPNLASIPGHVHGVSIITPPEITSSIVDEAIKLDIRHIWMQPGAENDEAIERALDAKLNVIAHGPCVLVVMGFRES